MKRLLTGIAVLGFLVLSYFIVQAGTRYLLDNDEIYHSHVAYLVAQGFEPYRDFPFIHTPVFNLILIPILSYFHYTFQAIFALRYLILAFFFIGAVAGGLIVRKLFGKGPAIVFLFLYFAHPFVTFSSVQIRPDTFMMVCYLAGFLFMVDGWEKRSKILIFMSGFLLSLSSVTLLKIVPSIVITIVGFAVLVIMKRKWKVAAVFLAGFLIPIMCFGLYFAIKGDLLIALKSVFIYSSLVLRGLIRPTPISFFFQPSLYQLYGDSRIPIPWIYTIFIFLAGSLSMIMFTVQTIKSRKKTDRTVFLLILVGSSIAHAVFLVSARSVTLQYYLPFLWILVAFTADGVGKTIHTIKNRNIRSVVISVALVGIFAIILSSLQTLRIRAQMENHTYEQTIERIWTIVPADKPVFPNLLFRPLVYPVLPAAFYGDYPRFMLDEMIPIPKFLEDRKIPYLMVGDYEMQFYEPDARAYIQTHYERMAQGENLYKRKSN